MVKKDHKGINTAVATLVVLGVGMAVPILGSGLANAASVDAWDKVAQCESGGNWSLNYGDNGLSKGGLQFQRGSWSDALAYLRKKGYDTSAYPSWDNLGSATKQQQILAGEALLAFQGPSAWTCNAKVGYPLQSSGPNASMFKGGVAPYAPTSTPPVTSTPSTPTTPSTPRSTGSKYTVKSGDTLSGIAALKKVAGGWQALYYANKSVIGGNPDKIFPGQVLTLPHTATVKYTVVKGDTLSKIAAKYKVAGGWKALYEKNKDVIGPNPDLIKPGTILLISGGGHSTPSTPVPPTVPSTASWVSPLAPGSYTKGDNVIGNGSCISRSCGGHSGLDMIAPYGTPAKAIASGTVVFAGYGYADPGGAYGLEVIIKLPDGHYALYAHLSSATVRTGQSVSAGQMIGNVGSSGNSSGAHLHFEIRNDPKAFAVGVFLNPVTFMASKGVTL